jgi:apolipoprotein N-acyltransferase
VAVQEWTVPDQRSLSVKLVQGNVSIWDKWNPKKSSEILNNYLALSEQGQATDLIIWPEAAVPLLMEQLPEGFIEQLNQKVNSYTMFGIVEKDVLSNALYNSVVSTQKDGSFSFYRKIQLVPFGEFLPLKFLLQWLLNYLHIPMSDFSAYEQKQEPIDVKGVKIGVSICYEDAFANVIRASLPQADLLVNVSEDAWFGNSLAPHQRLQMAQMRAIENGRSLVRVSNNGLSAVINHKGKLLNIAPQFETFVFDAQVELRNGTTPFSLWGHKLVLSILGLLFLCSLVIMATNPVRLVHRTSL